MKNIRVAQLKKCLAKFNELQKQIKNCKPEVSDKKIVKDEINNGIEMAKHGLARGIAALSGETDKKSMGCGLKKIIASHKKLWLARNRTGGLKESLLRLENLKKDL